MALRGGGQPVLDRPVAEILARPHAVGVGGADDGKILGQGKQFCALRHGILDQATGNLQVVGDTRPGHHLDGGHAAILFGHGLSPSLGRGAGSSSDWPTFSTWGSAQLPEI